MNNIIAVETLEYVKQKMQAVTQMDTFKWMKPKFQQKVHFMVNLTYELLAVAFDEDEDIKKAFQMGFDLINEYYCLLYNKNDSLKQTLYIPVNKRVTK